MGEWDIDSPAKGESSRGRPPVSGRPADVRQPPGEQPGSASSAPPPAPPRAPAPEPRPEPAVLNRRRRRFSYAWLGAAGLILLVGIMVGFFISRAETAGDTAALADANARLSQLQAALTGSEDRNWTYYRTNQNLTQELAEAASTSSTAPPSTTAKGSYGPGIYLVGEDIPAGTYDGVVRGSVGYWARLKGTDGAIASIIDNGIVKGPFVLTIVSGDEAVELQDVTLTLR